MSTLNEHLRAEAQDQKSYQKFEMGIYQNLFLTQGGDVFFLKLSGQVSLDEGGLAHTTITN